MGGFDHFCGLAWGVLSEEGLSHQERVGVSQDQARWGAPPWLPGKHGAVRVPDQPSQPLQPTLALLILASAAPCPHIHAVGGWEAPAYLLSAGYVLSNLLHSLIYLTQLPCESRPPVCFSLTVLFAVHSDSLFFISFLWGRAFSALCLRKCLAPRASQEMLYR